MSLTNGLVLNGYYSLKEICAPLSAEWAECFCVVDVQGGPIKSLWVFDSPENESLYEQLYWEIPACKNTSTHGFRPGTFPRLAEHFNVDEWSYYYAIHASEHEALQRATALAPHGAFSMSFLEHLDEYADLFVCHGDGWWEFYTGHGDWFKKLKAWWPDWRERPVSQASKPP
ncbi:MAG TPA: hypothetical protein PLN21_04230 [Gemmatales bacterium]|nr:hypothetical protein [Gemmatales bacterium]